VWRRSTDVMTSRRHLVLLSATNGGAGRSKRAVLAVENLPAGPGGCRRALNDEDVVSPL